MLRLIAWLLVFNNGLISSTFWHSIP